jgi:ribosome biogenesis GTPase
MNPGTLTFLWSSNVEGQSLTITSWDPAALGWTSFFSTSVQTDEHIARVAAVHRGAVDAWCASGLERLRQSEPPASTGDWVIYDDDRVVRVLKRRTSLSRQGAGNAVHEQVLAANFDVVFVVTSMNKDFNVQRLLRTHAALGACGARVVFVLSKADLDLVNQGRYLRDLDEVLPDSSVLVTSVVLDMGLDSLRGLIEPGKTAVLLGSSGTGKSSLANALLGEQSQFVKAQRSGDDRGKHTTTCRELLRLPGGGLLLDSPGVRALRLWDAEGVREAFADIVELAGRCRFNDCNHDGEPECAIQDALDDETLSAARLKAWRKLEREVHGVAVRRSARSRRKQSRQFARMVRSSKKDRW